MPLVEEIIEKLSGSFFCSRAYLNILPHKKCKKRLCPSEDETELFLPHKLNESIKIKLKSFG